MPKKSGKITKEKETRRSKGPYTIRQPKQRPITSDRIDDVATTAYEELLFGEKADSYATEYPKRGYVTQSPDGKSYLAHLPHAPDDIWLDEGKIPKIFMYRVNIEALLKQLGLNPVTGQKPVFMGMGSAGVVYSYLTHDHGMLAIKFIGAAIMKDKSAQDLFAREAQTQINLAAIDVAPTVWGYGYLTDEKKVWIVINPTSGNSYYWNSETGKSVQSLPSNLAETMKIRHAFIVMQTFQTNLRNYLTGNSLDVSLLPVLETKVDNLLKRYVEFEWCMDIKTENIVLNVNGGDPVVRLIDFDPFYCLETENLLGFMNMNRTGGQQYSKEDLDVMILFAHLYILCAEQLKDGNIFLLGPLMTIFEQITKGCNPQRCVEDFRCLVAFQNQESYCLGESMRKYASEKFAFSFFGVLQEFDKTLKSREARKLTSPENQWIQGKMTEMQQTIENENREIQKMFESRMRAYRGKMSTSSSGGLCQIL